MPCAGTAAGHPADLEGLASMLPVTEERHWPSAIVREPMSKQTTPSDSNEGIMRSTNFWSADHFQIKDPKHKLKGYSSNLCGYIFLAKKVKFYPCMPCECTVWS